jgi:hypothetical protein
VVSNSFSQVRLNHGGISLDLLGQVTRVLHLIIISDPVLCVPKVPNAIPRRELRYKIKYPCLLFDKAPFAQINSEREFQFSPHIFSIRAKKQGVRCRFRVATIDTCINRCDVMMHNLLARWQAMVGETP